MRVACCGLTTLDVVQCTDRFPAPDEKLQATSTLMEFGGPAANAAFTAAALGASATLVSAVGGGSVGRLVGEQLADASIDLLDLAGDDWQAPVSSVIVSGANRAVVSMNASDAAPRGFARRRPGRLLGAAGGRPPPGSLRECGSSGPHSASRCCLTAAPGSPG